MQQREDWTLLITGLLLVLTAAVLITFEPHSQFNSSSAPPPAMSPALLSDPFLQYPTATSVRVVWFTEFAGKAHGVVWGEAGRSLADMAPDRLRRAAATTTRLNRTREDGQSELDHPQFQNLKSPVSRPIWRHEAVVTGLRAGARFPYQVSSQQEDGTLVTSGEFTLAAAPQPGQALTILLTSDHQNMPMTAANLQKVEETVGRVDGIFMAGDLVNVPDRASEWFDNRQGNSFFPCLQGRASYDLERQGRVTRYRGGELIQHAPLFPAIGNHEVMGRYASTTPLKEQFNQPIPRTAALQIYAHYPDLFNPTADPALKRQWVINQSFNTDTYESLFSLPVTPVPNPERPEQTSRYYALSFGDVRLVSLYVTQIWRTPNLDAQARGRYREREADLGTPELWGHGQHSFEPINRGSLQYRWLQQELASPAFRQARYKVVMLHHPPHSLGDNIVPPFTDPVPVYDRRPDGVLQAVRYEYPIADDYLIRDLVPLLEQAGVDLVLYGHSHLWNRFQSPQGTHYLETSNVGNTYGAYWRDQSRQVPPATPGDRLGGFQSANYKAQGDPNGLEPIVPTLAPLKDDSGQPLPYLASNEITAFSIFETGPGTISSYYFDTRKPNSPVVKFDQFQLGAHPKK